MFPTIRSAPSRHPHRLIALSLTTTAAAVLTACGGGSSGSDGSSADQAVTAGTPAATSTPTATASAVTVGTLQIAQSMLFNSDDSALVLVAGKAALVKVNVTSADPKAAKPAGTLRVENADGSVLRDLQLAAPTADFPGTVPQVPRFQDSYTVTVPAELIKRGLKLTARIGSNTPIVLSPRVGGGVPIRFVPISIQIAGTAGKLPVDQTAHIQALFPVATVQTVNHNTYVSSRVTTLPTTETAWSDAYSKILRELADLRTLEGAARYDYYYGFIPKRTYGLAGLGYRPGTSSVGFDMPSNATSVRNVMAHELGHNFSLQHVACGNPAGTDPNYPYPNGNLGAANRYVWPYLASTKTFYDPRPTNRYDLMSYCSGEVFSDYSYRVMQVYLTPSDRAQATVKAQAVAPSQDMLLVSGEISASGIVALNPVKSFVGKPQADATGPYTLRIVTASSVTEQPFNVESLDHDSNLLHFGVTVPNPGTIQSLSILQGTRILSTQQAKAVSTNARPLSAGTPLVRAQETNGTLSLSWDAARHPYLTVTWVGADQRRNLAQDLSGGTATLSTTELASGGSFELLLSDGLNTVRTQLSR